MKRLIFVLLLISVLVLSLTSCGGFAVKNEAELESDIIENDSIFSYNAALKVSSFVIQKRQTNISEKTDYVWVSYSALSDTMEYEGAAKIVYYLYNDGWIFESYENEFAEYKPLIEFDDTIAEEALKKEGYFDCDLDSFEQKSDLKYEYTFFCNKTA